VLGARPADVRRCSARLLARWVDALGHDIIDVQRKFPGKYDAHIDEMVQYLWSGAW
jgi:hypothetical protein